MKRREWLALTAFAPCAAQTVDQEIRAMASRAPLAMQFRGTSEGDFRVWARAFEDRLLELLGPFQPPGQWKTVVERTVDCGDHQRHELLLKADDRRDLPLHLLLPTKPGKRPGILALHGHGTFGHDSVAGIDDSEERKAEIARFHYDYGRELVRRGYAVAAPCFTPFGRRLGGRDAYKGEDPCGVAFIRMQLLGKVLMAENLHDALWSLEHLARHDSVDAGRLGCVGLSLGGRMAMLASALSSRIRVAVLSGAMNMLQERVQLRFSCGAQIIPGLLQFGDVPEIASLIAPRPCLWEIGQQDKLMVKEWIGPALDRMRRAWSASGAADRLQVDSFEGGHQWNGVKAYPLLASVLRP